MYVVGMDCGYMQINNDTEHPKMDKLIEPRKHGARGGGGVGIGMMEP